MLCMACSLSVSFKSVCVIKCEFSKLALSLCYLCKLKHSVLKVGLVVCHWLI